MAKIKSTKIGDTPGDRILNWVLGTIIILFGIIILYPLIYVISCSISSSEALEAGKVVLWPVDISNEAYYFVLKYRAVWIGFRNSIFYCFCDCVFQMTMTILIAYPLSRRYFGARRFYTLLFYISTRISAGMIPNFILRCDLGLFDNIWAILISGAIAVGHILMLRTAITSNIPGDLFDAAMIDGASHLDCVFKIVVPLTKATLSVLTLYCMVGQWNDYFTPMMYLRDANLYPLVLVVRPIMQAATNAANYMNEGGALSTDNAQGNLENVRYALIIITTAPVLIAYAFVSKYFKGGVMVGSVKG